MTLKDGLDSDKSTRSVETGCGSLIVRVRASVACTAASILSAEKPQTTMSEAPTPPIFTTRRIDHAASSAVTGLPEAKVTPARNVRVMVRLSSETVQASASAGFKVPSAFAGTSTRVS